MSPGTLTAIKKKFLQHSTVCCKNKKADIAYRNRISTMIVGGNSSKKVVA